MVLPDLVIRVSFIARALPNQSGKQIVAIEQAVGGFDVAVEQTDLVGRMRSFGDLVDDADHSSGIQRPPELCSPIRVSRLCC